MAADVGDAAQLGRAVGQRRERGDGRGRARRRRRGRRRCRRGPRCPRRSARRGRGVTSAPIWSSRSRSRSPACVVYCGQPGRCTRPPVTTAAAANGAAFDRSGSTWTSRAPTGPGVDPPHATRSASSTTTPTSRSASTVMTTCGALGIGGPTCSTTRPSSKRAAASSSPDTNWLDADASIRSVPPRTRPVPRTVNGSRPASAGLVRLDARVRAGRPARSPSGAAGPPGRRRSAPGPGPARRREGRSASRCRRGRSRSSAGPRNGPGVTSQSGPKAPAPGTSSTRAPRAASAPAMSPVSRECRGARSREGSSARAASTR